MCCHIKNHTVNVTGHPSDLDKEGKILFTAEGKIRSVEEETFTYDIDTAGGDSGSGVWGQWKGLNGYFCVGVHTYDLSRQGLNQATRLSERRFREVISWIQNN
jgi:glutamyl endopeptidase